MARKGGHSVGAQEPAVIVCACKHPAQDRLYGSGKRLHNNTRKGPGGSQQPGHRCTVCRNVVPLYGKKVSAPKVEKVKAATK